MTTARLTLKDGRPLYAACEDRMEYCRIYQYILRHKVTPDQALKELKGDFGTPESDDRAKKERRAALKLRNLETQMDVCFNQFCKLDEIANMGGDDRGILAKLRKEIRGTVETLLNIGETNKS